jgi:hypothetical protein|uniref:Uncharacterized protein n=1 Tax=Siphoviridae sp. ctqPo10 TaxID=2827948 RepID=A0A8S5SW48_9CAUD|nr:MAG TPA: hypothetical protein [Siphoviridae sp. ctqPo10]DAR46380.1 MAG TPA: hypothetical protein [Caudoviricetes sp.]
MVVSGLSHVRTVMFCLYRYPHDFMLEITYKGGYSVILDTMYKIGIQIISGVIAGCVLDFLRYYRCKNDRHNPNSDR